MKLDGDVTPTSHKPSSTSVRRERGAALVERLIIAVFLCIPLADVVTGIVALTAGLSSKGGAGQSLVTLLPGMVVRAVLLILICCGMWLRRSSAAFIVLGAIASLFLLSEAASLLSHQALADFIYGLSYAFKLILAATVALYVALAERPGFLNTAVRVIPFSFFVYTFAVTIGHLSGFEYTTYGGLGSSGLMIEGSANSISLIILVGSVFVLHEIFESKKTRSRLFWFIVYINAFYASWLLLTKGAVIGLLFPSIAYAIRRCLRWRNPIPFLSLMALLFLLALLFALVDWTKVGIVSRTIQSLEYHGGDILKAAFGGRLYFIESGWHAFLYGYSPLQWVLGAGAASARSMMANITGIEQGVESDFLDIALVYGFAGFGIVIFVWGTLLTRATLILLKPSSTVAHCLAVQILLLTGLAVVAGHVITSGLGGHILGLAAGLLFRQPYLQISRDGKIS